LKLNDILYIPEFFGEIVNLMELSPNYVIESLIAPLMKISTQKAIKNLEQEFSLIGDIRRKGIHVVTLNNFESAACLWLIQKTTMIRWNHVGGKQKIAKLSAQIEIVQRHMWYSVREHLGYIGGILVLCYEERNFRVFSFPPDVLQPADLTDRLPFVDVCSLKS